MSNPPEEARRLAHEVLHGHPANRIQDVFGMSNVTVGELRAALSERGATPAMYMRLPMSLADMLFDIPSSFAMPISQDEATAHISLLFGIRAAFLAAAHEPRPTLVSLDMGVKVGVARERFVAAIRQLIGEAIYRGYSNLPEQDDLSEKLTALIASISGASPTAGSEDTERLDWILNQAMLCPIEDGDTLGLFIGDAKDEHLKAFAVVAECTGDDGDEVLTAEDAPWLTEQERAYLNGSGPPSPITKATLRRTIDAARSSAGERPE